MTMPKRTKTIDPLEAERKMTEESISAMMQWGYGVQITYNAKHYEIPWSVHITKISEHEDDPPVSAFFGGGSPGVAVQLAWATVQKWEYYAARKMKQTMLPVERAFAEVVNQRCLENESNTPDFILGEFLAEILARLNTTIKARDKWYGVNLEPGKHRCREYDWEHGERATINVGAIFKIGRRLWRLTELPLKEQGSDGWRFELTERSNGDLDIDQRRTFTRSELQWLYGHGSFVGQPVDAEGAVL